MNSEELIRRLCTAFGPSGREEAVAALIKKEIADIAPNAFCDGMGNVIAVMRYGDLNAPKRTRIMLSAHMDEVGFMINELRSEGYLGFDTVGGISEGVLSGRRVSVLGASGELINGVIASKAIHHKDKKERGNTVPVDKLYIDIGAADREQAEQYVGIGSFAVFDSEFYTFGDGMVKAKALDDRMGCAALIEIMRGFASAPPKGNTDVCFCFTVREEIGLSGAGTAAYALRPDCAVVLETTAVADIADVPAAERVADVGGGAVISVMDRSTVYCRELIDIALGVSRRENIKAQLKRYVSGGNDAGVIHKTADGVKALAVSVPTRYLHSPACVASMEDYNCVRSLCAAIVREIGEREEI